MNIALFKIIIADIESKLEGEGYGLTVTLKSGRTVVDYAWGKVPETDAAIYLEHPDRPMLYVPIESIEFIEMVSA